MSRDQFSPLHLAWTRIRDSLWFVPSVSDILATVLAMIAVQLPTPEATGEFARV